MNTVRLDIDMLTWDRSQEMLFVALELAKKVDNERFSNAPNMIFYLVREIAELIA